MDLISVRHRLVSGLQNECRRLLQELLHAAALQTSNISAAFQSGAGEVARKYAKQLDNTLVDSDCFHVVAGCQKRQNPGPYC